MAQNAKQYLATALLYLMKEKSIEEISVSELTKKAGVSRMSYYRYFNEKSEILDYYMHYLLDVFTKWEKEHTCAPFGSREHIKSSLEFFKEYGDFAMCIYKSGNDSIMLKAVNQYMEQLPLAGKKFKSSGKRTPASRFALYYYAGAIYNCYIQWVLEDFKTPVDQLAGIIRRK